MNKHIKSRYITDVDITDNYICLHDSAHSAYYIDTKNETVVAHYKNWFNNHFKVGENQHLTVFECDEVENDGEIHNIITSILN